MTGTVDYVDLQARLQPSRLAAQDLLTGESWTYRQFDRAISQYAALLTHKGVTRVPASPPSPKTVPLCRFCTSPAHGLARFTYR